MTNVTDSCQHNFDLVSTFFLISAGWAPGPGARTWGLAEGSGSVAGVRAPVSQGGLTGPAANRATEGAGIGEARHIRDLGERGVGTLEMVEAELSAQ